MKSHWKEECAVIGVWNHEEAARIAYLGLYAMQHRGQEASGIVSLDDKNHIVHKGLGLVADIFKEAELERLKGNSAIGHNRYSTTGQNTLINAQPLNAQMLSGPLAVAHNGNIVNTDQLKNDLKKQGAIFSSTNDTEVILHLLSRINTSDLTKALQVALPQLAGAFSFAFLSHDRLVAARDPYGFRPLVLGRKKNANGKDSVIIASETCAFDLVEAKFEREIRPGEIFWVDETGEHSVQFQESTRKAQCVFEHVYFARPDSIVFNQSVYSNRKAFGLWLAKENPVNADVVVPVPDSGIPAAIGYSIESKIPFELGIIRNHYVGRTFIQPQQSVRNFGVKIKLNAQSAILSGKRVIVVDDSLVRGTTSQKIIRLIRAAGAKEVHMRIASPPTTGPCYYGVDTPQKSQLIAANQSIEQIKNFIEADSLGYLSIGGMFDAIKVQNPKKEYCAACFDGDYPTPL